MVQDKTDKTIEPLRLRMTDKTKDILRASGKRDKNCLCAPDKKNKGSIVPRVN